MKIVDVTNGYMGRLDYSYRRDFIEILKDLFGDKDLMDINCSYNRITHVLDIKYIIDGHEGDGEESKIKVIHQIYDATEASAGETNIITARVELLKRFDDSDDAFTYFDALVSPEK